MTTLSNSKHVDVKNLAYYPHRRIQATIQFLKKNITPPARILDLGVDNMLADIMRQEGFDVENTQGEDLDIDYQEITNKPVDLITSFEIFEHMVAPFNVLRAFPKGQKIICTVPLKVWFKKAHWHKTDPWDRHYHEFEPRQFDMLLEKAGWEIQDTELWKFPAGKVNGIRPLLRFLYPTYYAVFAIKKN